LNGICQLPRHTARDLLMVADGAGDGVTNGASREKAEPTTSDA
jgi:hypothetical protein